MLHQGADVRVLGYRTSIQLSINVRLDLSLTVNGIQIAGRLFNHVFFNNLRRGSTRIQLLLLLLLGILRVN